jgi:hypothetical protein
LLSVDILRPLDVVACRHQWQHAAANEDRQAVYIKFRCTTKSLVVPRQMRKERPKNSWRYFRALVNGRNFQLAWAEGKNEKTRIKRTGFYTTVHVRARSQKEAELRAMKVLRAEKALRKSIRNPASDPPRMFLQKLEELSSFKGCRLPRTGFAFYSERGPRTKR